MASRDTCLELGAGWKPAIVEVYMLRFFLFIAVTLTFSWVVWAQPMPEIAVGTSQKEVIRMYGAAKGRSAMGTRESWLYEHFQVVFEKGRVLRVVSLDETRRSDISPGFAARIEPGPAMATDPLPAAAAPPIQPTHTATAPVVAHHVIPPEAPTWLERLDLFSPWFWLKVSGSVLLGGAVVVVVRRQISTRLREKQEVAARAATAFQVAQKGKATRGAETIAATLNRANALAHVAAAVPRPQSSATNAGALSLELIRSLDAKHLRSIVARYYRSIGIRAECTDGGVDRNATVNLFHPGADRPYC